MKDALRKELLSKRKGLPRESVLARSAAVKESLFSFRPFAEASSVMFYVSFGKEVFTHRMIEESFPKKAVVVPKTFGENIMPCKICSLSELSRSYFNVLEPIKENPFPPSRLDVIIVPGLGFTAKGDRIGYGKGFFDRFLEKTNAFKIGLCFDEFLLEKIPVEAGDRKVDAVITDKRVIVVK